MGKYNAGERELINDMNKDVKGALIQISGAIDKILSIKDWWDDKELSAAHDDLLDAAQSLNSAAAYIKDLKNDRNRKCFARIDRNAQ
jgi:hypothetical protein